MRYSAVHKVLFPVVVLTVFAVYGATVYRSVPFWESGEYITAAWNLGNPHPPPVPLFLVLAHILSPLAAFGNPAWQLHLVNALFTALAAGVFYLLGTRLTYAALTSRENAETTVIIHIAGVTAACTIAFAVTVWTMATQFQPGSLALLLTALILWMGFLAYDAEEERMALRYIVLIAFLLGVSSGVHWSVLYAAIPISFLLYFRYYYFSSRTFLIFSAIAAAGYFFVLRGLLWALPWIGGVVFGAASGAFSLGLPLVFIVGVCITGAYLARTYMRNTAVSAVCIAAGLYLTGYSIMLVVPVRSGAGAVPDFAGSATGASLQAYASSEGIGEHPPLLNRKWSEDAEAKAQYARYESDFSYFVEYQIQHIFLRYLFWNFIGKSGDMVNAPAYFGDAEEGPVYGKWSWFDGVFPLNYLAIPFILGLLGMLRLFVARPVAGITVFLAFVVFGFWMVVVANPAEPILHPEDIQFAAAFSIFGLWVGVGAGWIASYVVRVLSAVESFNTQAFRVGMSVVLLVGLFIAAPVKMFSENYTAQDAHNHYIAEDFAYNLLQSCDENAILFTAGDNDTFPLLYLQQVRGIRPDVCIVNVNMLDAGWYSVQVRERLKSGAVPVHLEKSKEDILFLAEGSPEALKQTSCPSDEKLIRIPVSDTYIDEYTADLPRGARLKIRARHPKEMVFVSYAQFPFELETEPGTVLYYRPWKDVMIEDIIRSTDWKRPVYFSVTCSDEAYIGMNDYLRLDGIAYRVTPVRYTSGDYVRYGSLIDQLLYPSTKFHQGRKTGFYFRKYHRQFFSSGETVQGIAGNYRNAFMQLAKYQLNALHSKEGAVASLNAMRKAIPGNVFPMDFRYAYDVGLLYKEAGDRWRYRKMMEQVERECKREIKRNPLAVQSIYSPYRYLFEFYQSEGRLKEARSLLDRILEHIPDAPDVKQRRVELDSLIANQ